MDQTSQPKSSRFYVPLLCNVYRVYQKCKQTYQQKMYNLKPMFADDRVCIWRLVLFLSLLLPLPLLPKNILLTTLNYLAHFCSCYCISHLFYVHNYCNHLYNCLFQLTMEKWQNCVELYQCQAQAWLFSGTEIKISCSTD